MRKYIVALSFLTATSSVLGMQEANDLAKRFFAGLRVMESNGWQSLDDGVRGLILKEDIQKLEEVFVDLQFGKIDVILRWATKLDRVKVAEWAIENGADMTDGNNDGSTPLSLAFRSENTGMKRLFINHILSKESTENAAKIISNLAKNIPDDKYNQVTNEILRFIWDFAKSTTSNNLEKEERHSNNSDLSNIARTPVFSQSKEMCVKIMKDLVNFIKRGDINKLKNLLNKNPEIHPNLILSMAAKEEQFDIVKYAVERGANVNITDTNGITPLMAISINGNFEIFEYLMDQGIKVNKKGKNNYTSLIYATKNNHTDIAKSLIEHGADVNVVSGDQDTPIMWASKHNNFEVVSLLLKHGAKKSINVANKEGTTTAIWAAGNNNLRLLKLLKKYGADIHKKDNRGYVPMDFALQNNNEKMMLFLIENGLNLEEKLAVVKELPLIWFSYKNNFSLVKALVDRGANVNIKSSDGDTPLMFAVSNDNYEMVRYLINHGANVKVQNNDGDTPVQLAGKNKNRKMLKFLIDCISTAPAA